jgi:hypothetical protein
VQKGNWLKLALERRGSAQDENGRPGHNLRNEGFHVIAPYSRFSHATLLHRLSCYGCLIYVRGLRAVKRVLMPRLPLLLLQQYGHDLCCRPFPAVCSGNVATVQARCNGPQ